MTGRERMAEAMQPRADVWPDQMPVMRRPIYTHTCGAIGDRLNLMKETGTDGIVTLDQPPPGTVDLAGVRPPENIVALTWARDEWGPRAARACRAS